MSIKCGKEEEEEGKGKRRPAANELDMCYLVATSPFGARLIKVLHPPRRHRVSVSRVCVCVCVAVSSPAPLLRLKWPESGRHHRQGFTASPSTLHTHARTHTLCRQIALDGTAAGGQWCLFKQRHGSQRAERALTPRLPVASYLPPSWWEGPHRAVLHYLERRWGGGQATRLVGQCVP